MLSKKKFHKRKELIEIAMEEFQKHGYDDASLNKIIHNTGIAKMTFYYHYESKEELFLSLFDEIVSEFKKFKNQYSKEQPLSIDNETLLKVLEHYSKIIVKFIEENPLYFRFLISSYSIDNLEIKEKVKNKLVDLINPPLEKMFNKAYDRKEIRQDIDRDFLFKYLLINLLFIIQEITNVIDSNEINIKQITKIIRDSFKILERILFIEDEPYLYTGKI